MHSFVLAEMGDTALDGKDGAKMWVTTASEADDFASDAILLVGECEHGECNPGEVRHGKGGAGGA